jgi:hypothetical protein
MALFLKVLGNKQRHWSFSSAARMHAAYAYNRPVRISGKRRYAVVKYVAQRYSHFEND